MYQPALVPIDPPWLPEALGALAERDLLTAAQIAALVGRGRPEVEETLARLVSGGHVGKVVGDVASPVAHVLTRRGARYLAELTGDDPVPVRRPRGAHMLAHELVKNDLAIVLRLLEGLDRLTVLRWETASSALADAVLIQDGRRTQRVALVADAFVVVDIAGERTALLVEIDMSTVSIARMRAKYAGYAAWWRQNGPERRFGVRSLRVLTIANHAGRMARLRQTAHEAAGATAAGLLWFGTSDALDPDAPEKLLAPAFWTARPDDRALPLFAPS